jgi:hypothetical protein
LSIRFKRMAPAGRHLVDVIGAGALLYQARTERWVWWSFMFAACRRGGGDDGAGVAADVSAACRAASER